MMTKTASLPEFPDYRFTEDGGVVSFICAPRILKPIRTGDYLGVTIRDASGKLQRRYVHRLICEAFHGPAPDGTNCCHNDGNRANNSADNLRWDTPANNNRDKIAHGTATTGSRNPNAKLNASVVERMRAYRAETGAPYAAIADQFNISTMTAYRAIVGQSWSAQ